MTKETRYFISSLKGSAQQLAEAARTHWGIENSRHWVLDVTMNEDQRRVRPNHAPENLALLRRLALNRIKKTKRPQASVRGSIKKAGWDNSFLEAILIGLDAIALRCRSTDLRRKIVETEARKDLSALGLPGLVVVEG